MLSATDPSAAVIAFVQSTLVCVTPATAESSVQQILETLSTFSRQQPETAMVLTRLATQLAMSTFLSDRSPNEARRQVIQRLIVSACSRTSCTYFLSDVLGEANLTQGQLQNLLTQHMRLNGHQILAVLVALYHASSESTRNVAKTMLIEHLGRNPDQQIKGDWCNASTANELLYIAQQEAALQDAVPYLRKEVITAESCAIPESGSVTLASAARALSESISIAGLVAELGTAVLSTKEGCMELLGLLPTVRPSTIAAILAALTVSTPESTAAQQSEYAAMRSVMQWSSGTSKIDEASPVLRLSQCVKDAHPNLDWGAVIRALDSPDIVVGSFAPIVAAYKRVKGHELPTDLFMGRWNNLRLQATALRFAIKNPALVSRPKAGQHVSRDLAPAEVRDDVDWWSSVAFVESVVGTCGIDRDMDAMVHTTAGKAPSLLFASLGVAQPLGTVAHLTLALSILRQHGMSIVTESVASTFHQLGRTTCLILLLSEYVQHEPSKVVDVAEAVVRLHMVPAILKSNAPPLLAITAAIAGRELKMTPDPWLEGEIDPSSRPIPPPTAVRIPNPRAAASAVVEVCDEFVAKQKFTGAANYALRLFIKSPIAAKMPQILEHAQSLVDAMPDNFSEEVERESEGIFRTFLFDNTSNPIVAINNLHASTKPKDRQVFACMVNMMFEESTCVASYSWSALEIFARLLGHVIQKNMLSSNQLQTALRIVLHSVQAKPSDRMFEFGVKALDVFKYRLPEWPQYGRQLKQVDFLDMRIPGICAIINGGAHTQQTSTSDAHATAQTTTHTDAVTGYHQLDIRSLMSEQTIAPPSATIQDQLNFLVGNTDPSNVEANAAELAKILTTDLYPYFADYFVVKRVALEPNHHRMYLQLLETLGLSKFDVLIRSATVAAAKRMLNSEKIRHDTGDRSLLKSLGSWYGQLTVARNIPPLATEIEFGRLLHQALRDGKLIAVVPFMAKVLESVAHSRVFKPPNPWTMRQLEYLYEVYRLRDLKMTLCFEVDLLLKNIDVKIDDLMQFSMSHPHMHSPYPPMAKIRATLDVSNSTDFRPEDPSVARATAAVAPPPDPAAPKAKRSAPLSRDAAPFQPKTTETAAVASAATVHAAPMAPLPPTPPPPPPMAAVSAGQAGTAAPAAVPPPPAFPPPLPLSITDGLIVVSDDARLLQDKVEQYRSTLLRVFDTVLHECRSVVLRIAEIAAVATKEIVTKDFARDADTGPMFVAAQHMVRSLAANLCTTNKEFVSMTFVRFVRAIAVRVAKDNAVEEENLVKRIQANNLQLVFRVFEARTAVAAAEKIERLLTNFIAERRPRLEPSAEVLRIVPDALRPVNGGAMIASKLYTEFQLLTPLIELLHINLKTIEELSQKHYLTSTNATPLSMSNEDFYAKSHSQHHIDIREKMTELGKLVASETAPTVMHLSFRRLMAHADKHLNNVDSTQRLMGEIYLWLLKRVREVHQPLAKDFTQLFLAHERAWKYPWLAAHLFKIQVIDVADFDAALARELLSRPQGDRSVTEFAGSLINSTVLSEKMSSSREFRLTLKALEDIHTRERKGGQAHAATMIAPTFAMPPYAENVHTIHMLTTSPATADRVAYANEALTEYANIVQLKTEATMDEWKQQQRKFLDKLNSRGVLKADTGHLDQFLTAMVEVSVSDFATNVLRLEREHPRDPPQPHLLVSPPPPRYRSSHDLFRRVDTFCEVVHMLSRCATRVDHPFAAEIHLLSRVLKCVSSAASANHDAFLQPPEVLRGRPSLPDGHAYQNEFQQQPYVRFFSNLMLAMRPSDTNVAQDAVGKLFAEALHILAPIRHPAFAFGWLELVCHRSFTSRVFRCQDLWQPYVKLIIDALRFVDAHTRRDRISPSVLLFTKSFLKLMLVVLHDFPDVLITHHQVLCDAIPTHCVQLRNIVLCAFPSKMRLPDPFQKWIDGPIDLAATASVAVPEVLHDRFDPPLKMDDLWKEAPFSKIVERLRTSASSAAAGFAMGKWSIPAINALVLEAATFHLKNVLPESQTGLVTIDVTPEMPIVKLFAEVASGLDNEGRYYFINALVNQLRWPNAHTMLFAKLITLFFAPHLNGGYPWSPALTGEQVHEQITRALVERLIICRPHPWGLLVTFVAIIVNPKYQFWDRPFVYCSTEVEAALRQLADTVRATNERNQPPQPSA